MNILRKFIILICAVALNCTTFVGIQFDIARAVSVDIDCSVGSPRTIASGVDFDPGDDLTLEGAGTCILNTSSTLTLNSLTIGDDSENATILTHDYNTTSKVNYIDLDITDTFTIKTNAKIDVSGKGFEASEGDGQGNNGEGNGGGTGAGHGGAGGSPGNRVYTGATYGTSTSPTTLGSGGGEGNSAAATGEGSGGGAVKIQVGGVSEVDGDIIADGAIGAHGSGLGSGGGGSGGSIWLLFNAQVTGSANITADGANGRDDGGGAHTISGGGGGGHIYIEYVIVDGATIAGLAMTASGGTTTAPATAGSDGNTGSTSYEKPSTPTLSAPPSSSFNADQNVALSGSTYSATGNKSHLTSDWRITTDSGCSTSVWYKDDDSSNLTSITVNVASGTFTGVLSGETELAQNTYYYACVRYTNVVGDSEWAANYFQTVTGITSASQTWDFNEGAGDYTTGSDLQLDDSSNSLAELAPLTNFAQLSGVLDKRRPISIQNLGSTVTDYQVEVNVTYDSDMQADFDDIRFTDSDGSTEIDYWLEEKTDSTSATFWVEVPSLTNGFNTIYMYYGDAGLSTTSNIDNTFLFGDDFEDDSVDVSKWTTTGTLVESGGELLMNAAEGVWATSFAAVDDTSTTFKLNIGANNQVAHYGYVESDHRFEEDLDSGEKGFLFNPWTDTNTYTERGGTGIEQYATFTTLTGENEFSITYDDGNRINFIYPGGLAKETTSTSIATVADDTHLQIYSHTQTDMRAEHVYVRNHASGDLSTEVGSEEDATSYAIAGFDPGIAPASTQSRRPITLTNSGSALSDYQVRLTVFYDSSMQTDFGDLRFTDSDGTTEIDYWIEKYTASQVAIVWVEVPTIAATGTDTTIYMYYETTGTTVTTSNVDNTFIFGEDFGPKDSGSLDADWTEITNGGAMTGVFVDSDDVGVTNVTGSAWKKECTISGDCDWWSSSGLDAAIYIEDPDPTVLWEAITLVLDSSQSNDHHNGIGLYEASTDGYMYGDCEGGNYCIAKTGGGASGSSVRDVPAYPHYLKIIKTSANGLGANDSYEFWESPDAVTWTQSATVASDVMDNITLFTKDWIVSGDNSYTIFDNFFVKAYTANTITQVFGLEQGSGSYDDISVVPSVSGTHPTYTKLISMSHSGNVGTVKYQVSNNGTDYYYVSGGTWTTVTTDATDNNTIDEINEYLPLFDDTYTGDFYPKVIFVSSDGLSTAQVNSVTLNYDAGAPTSLADFDKSENTTTVATFEWTAASDPAFDHYEIWYGTDQSDVQNRTGTAAEWDDGDDANLATAGTTTTDVTGLTTGATYYAKIWAIDSFSQELTVSDVQFVMTVGGGSAKTVPKATFRLDSGSGISSSEVSNEADDSQGSNDLELEKKGLERLGIKLNTPESDTWIAVADNEIMQRSQYIQITQLDARLDELIAQGVTKVYFMFKYQGVLSPVYSKVFGDEKAQIITDTLVEDLEEKEDVAVEDEEVQENNQEIKIPDITEEKKVDGHAIAEIVKLKPGECFLIEGSDAVYYFSDDGMRHTFPNEHTYFSYYEGFDHLKSFTSEEVGEIPLGKNKKVSPGTWLVKITTDPKVYAVEPGGILRWVQSEEIAENLYGSQWNKKIIDVDDSQFADYEIGAPIVEAVHPDGVLITFDEDKFTDNDVIYYVRDSQLFEVSNQELGSFGARKNFIEVVDENDFDYIKAGIINDLL